MKTKNLETSVLQINDDGFGGWAHGVCYVGNREYDFETKHFEVGSKFGIENGRVSKLRIVRRYPKKKAREICAYDRGWALCPCPGNVEDIAAYKAVLEKYN